MACQVLKKCQPLVENPLWKERNNSVDTHLAGNLMKRVLKVPFSPNSEGFSNS